VMAECERLRTESSFRFEELVDLRQDLNHARNELTRMRAQPGRRLSTVLYEAVSSTAHGDVDSTPSKSSPSLPRAATSSPAAATVNSPSLAQEIQDELKRLESQPVPMDRELGFEFYTMLLMSFRINHEDLANYSLDPEDAANTFRYLVDHKVPFHLWPGLLQWALISNKNIKANTLTPSIIKRSKPRPRVKGRSRIGTRPPMP
jgi:hypothetical protein